MSAVRATCLAAIASLATIAAGCTESEDGDGQRIGLGDVINPCLKHGGGCPDAGPPDAGPPPPPPTVPCRMTGGGQIEAGENPDSFGGNAQPFPSRVGMHWNHVTHEGDHFLGVPATIECFDVPGAPADPPSAPANAIRYTGTGVYNGETGCDFVVYVEDHGEPGTEDFYAIQIECDSGVSYSAAGPLSRGNLQIHEVPPGHLP